MLKKHLDESFDGAVKALRELIGGQEAIERIDLIQDIFGKLRLILWCKPAKEQECVAQIRKVLSEVAVPFWEGEIWDAPGKTEADRNLYETAWESGIDITPGRFRVTHRHRNRSAWFQQLSQPLWPERGAEAGPPIIVFYSFKGGVGRTTALASFAVRRARLGERVAVLDLDLDAPGVGTLLAADPEGTIAPWGVVDYFLERPVDQVNISDYYHACRRQAVTGEGEILVVPAGNLNPSRHYLEKLSRMDLELRAGDIPQHPLPMLLKQVANELKPNWLLLDARAGLSEPAGFLLNGFAHLYVLFGTSSEQGWEGLQLVLNLIGAERVLRKDRQNACMIVHSMLPPLMESEASQIKKRFQERSLKEFMENYYAPDPQDPDEELFWYVRDAESSDAPHVPVAISYDSKLAPLGIIDEAADLLAESREYGMLADRITGYFEKEEDVHASS